MLAEALLEQARACKLKLATVPSNRAAGPIRRDLKVVDHAGPDVAAGPAAAADDLLKAPGVVNIHELLGFSFHWHAT